MRWQPWTTIVLIVLASGALAWWQYHEYSREGELARESLRRQADSLANALIGGIRSHRNRGRFFADQLQGSLDGLVQASDILAVAVTDDEGRSVLSAGRTEFLTNLPGAVSGGFWEPSGYRLVQRFELPPILVRPRGGDGRGRDGPRWGRQGAEDVAGQRGDGERFSAPGPMSVVLLLDRVPIDARCRRAAWLRGSVFVAGVMVFVCTSLAGRLVFRAAARTRVLETEARHLRDLGQAAAGLAHETRNPLGLIRGWTQRLAQSDLPSTEQQQQAEAIVEECDRVTSRINQFLAFARPAEPKPESVDVKEMLDQLALVLEPDLDAMDLKLVYPGIRARETLWADRELFRQAIFNLVQNAVQASSNGDTIEISVCRGPHGIRRIAVADRGPGVDPAAIGSLFTPYYTTKAEGAGLGLAIVRRIAGAHGWEVGYTRRAGGGSVFYLDQIHD
jgi:signal transduction histidine kinase